MESSRSCNHSIGSNDQRRDRNPARIHSLENVGGYRHHDEYAWHWYRGDVLEVAVGSGLDYQAERTFPAPHDGEV